MIINIGTPNIKNGDLIECSIYGYLENGDRHRYWGKCVAKVVISNYKEENIKVKILKVRCQEIIENPNGDLYINSMLTVEYSLIHRVIS